MNNIFIKEKAILNNLISGEYEKIGIDLNEATKDKQDGDKRNDERYCTRWRGRERGRDSMCNSYYRHSCFWRSIKHWANAGQVRGPVQITFSRSVEQVVPLEHSITSMAVATKRRSRKAIRR